MVSYLCCDNCSTRLRKLGKRQLEYLDVNYQGEMKWYLIQYICPNCNAKYIYSEFFDTLKKGILKINQLKEVK